MDTYDDHVPGGRYYNPVQKNGSCFTGLMDLLLKMERMLNAMELPQSFSNPRIFLQPPEHPGASISGGRYRCGELATFEVKILFRQNASWQGCVTWLEEGKEEHFRSVLELSILMDSALTSRCREQTTA